MPNNSAYIYQGLLSRGYNPAQAAALAGNIEQESSFNPTAWNGSSQAGGLMQWRQDRLSGLESYANQTGRSPANIDTQLDYIVHEMQGPEAKSSADFLNATTVPEANAALKSYVRYGDDETGNRLAYSMAFAKQQPRQFDPYGNPVQPSQPQSTPAAAPATSAPGPSNAAPLAPSDDDLISKYLGAAPPTMPPAAGAAQAATPGTAPAAANDDDALISKYLGAPANSNAPPPGIGAPEKATGDRAAELRAATAPAQAPELFPGSNAFQNAVVNNMLGIGPLVGGAIDAVGSRITNMLTGQSPDHAVAAAHAREAAEAAGHPILTGAGSVVGAVLPFTAVGPTGLASKLLGTADTYGAGAVGDAALRTLAGAGSSAALAGADTAERDGDLGQIGHNMLTAGLIGGAAAPVAHVAGSLVGKGVQAFLGPSAPKMLANAVTADQAAPGAVNQLIGNIGPGAMAADIGPNTQHLAGALGSLPGEPQAIVRNALGQRAAQAGNRLTGDVAQTLGSGQPLGALTDSVIAQQKAAADPLYKAVRGTPVQITPELHDLTQRPAIRNAIDQAQTMMQNDGVQPASTVQLYDYAKQVLDDQASTAIRKGDNNAARQFTSLSNQLRSAVDAQVPAYAQARDAFAGPAKVLDAVQTGQDIFTRKMTPEELQSTLVGMSSSEKDGLLAGAQSAVQEMIGNARNDAQGVKQAFQSSNAKQKLAILLGQKAANQIDAALGREAQFARTQNIAAGNSETAARLAAQKSVNPDLAAIPGQLPPQTWQAMVLAGLGKARQALTAGYRSAQNKELANMLTQGPLSPEHSAAVANAAGPRNSLIPGAAVALGTQDSGNDKALLGNITGQPDMVFRNGRWIPRIYVRGANVIGAQ